MEIAFIITALGMGIASGFHCVGMCGPIALSMGLSKSQAVNYYLQNITYQLGRVVTYTFLGALVGIIGEGFALTGFQQSLSIITGILLIIMALFSFGGKDFASKIPGVNKGLYNVKLKLSQLLQKADLKSRFTTGILNGFLPCGMVYMALTASLASGGIWQSATFMAFFGLATIPFMFAVVLVGNLMSIGFRQKIVKLMPIAMIILGILFILRGFPLGIPLLSPKDDVLQVQSTDSTSSQVDHKSCH